VAIIAQALEAQLAEITCARGNNALVHARICIGIASFPSNVSHNLRVLWYSLPSHTRREHLLKDFRKRLEQRRKKSGNEKHTEHRFLRFKVCKLAFLSLKGLSSGMLTESGQGALRGQRSPVSVREMGTRTSMKNHQKTAMCLSARQWLEHSAATNAEQSSMDDKAYLLSGREAFYYYNYR